MTRPALRRHGLPLAVIALVALLLAARFLNGSLGDWSGDNVQYLLLAEALAGGHGYVDLQFAGAPAHTHYPPLFPVVLTPFAGAPLVVIKGFCAVLAVAGVLLAYALAARRSGRGTALLVALATLASGVFLDPAFSVMSETLYLALSMGALYAAARDGRGWAIAAGMLAGAAILARTIGLVLLGAFLLASLSRARRRNGLLSAAIAAVIAAPWFVFAVWHDGLTHWRYFGEFVRGAEVVKGPGFVDRPAVNALSIVSRLLAAPVPQPVRAFGAFATTAFTVTLALAVALGLAIAALGLFRALRTRCAVDDLYAASYVLLLLFWLPAGFRMLMPVLPLLIGLSALGVGGKPGTGCPDTRIRCQDNLSPAFLAAVVVVNLALTFGHPLFRDRLDGHYRRWWPEYIAAVCALGHDAPPGATVIAYPDNVPYFFAGLHAAPLEVSAPPETMRTAILDSGASYLITTPPQDHAFGSRVRDAITAYPATFRQVARYGPAVVVYAIERGDEGVSAARPMEPVRRSRAWCSSVTE